MVAKDGSRFEDNCNTHRKFRSNRFTHASFDKHFAHSGRQTKRNTQVTLKIMLLVILHGYRRNNFKLWALLRYSFDEHGIKNYQ